MAYKIVITILCVIFLCAACFFGYQYNVANRSLRETKDDLDRWVVRCFDYIGIVQQYRSDYERAEKRLAEVEREGGIIRDRANQLKERLRQALGINYELERIIRQ